MLGLDPRYIPRNERRHTTNNTKTTLRVSGVTYDSVLHAGRVHGISQCAARYRGTSDNWPGWELISLPSGGKDE